MQGDFLRHKCNQDNKLKYGWKAHDGINFGEQIIEENTFDLWTKVVKRPRLGRHGGDWTWKIEAKPKSEKTTAAVTFLVYFATDNDGTLQVEHEKTAGTKLERIRGQTSGLGEFTVKFRDQTNRLISYFNYKEYINSFNDIHDDVMRRLAGKMTKGNIPHSHLTL